VLPWSLDAVGGVNQVVINLYTRLEASGELEPRILIPDWSATELLESVASPGIRITRVRIRPIFAGRSLLRELTQYALTLPWEMLKIAALVRRYDVRVVNCHYVGPHTITWSLASALGVFRGALVLSLHGLDIRTVAAQKGIRRRIWRRALAAAHAIVACSQSLAEETKVSLQLSGSNIATIHNGVDIAELRAMAAASGAAEPATRRPHIVTLGTFEHKKGHDLLIRAFAAVAREYPEAHLSILGRQSDTLESTRALVRDLRLESRITLRVNAPHAEAIAALRQADVFVLPSRNEAFSVALLEAGAMGRAVVATEVCGVPELIENGRTGVLVPPESAEALAQAILHVLRDESLARRLGETLQRRVFEGFTAEATFASYRRLLRERLTTAAGVPR
jgi:glycosyltransferase involved in cell wall biosynthesis